MEHKYAQVLRWIADGKKVQAYSEPLNAWIGVSDVDGCLVAIGANASARINHFRLAPRTVKVGDVELEAALSWCITGDEVWYTSMDGKSYKMIFQETSLTDMKMRRDCRLFATREAAEAANAAWVKLMTQGEA